MFFLCIKIFFARIIDVSLGTIRTVFIVKGNKFISSLIAFIEIFIWFYAARSALSTEVSSIFIVIAYALGYATGTYIGTMINEIFIEGVYSIQVISNKMKEKDILKIKKEKFGVTEVNTNDGKSMLYLTINKKRYKECIQLIKKIDSNSFIIVNDSKLAYNGYIKKK